MSRTEPSGRSIRRLLRDGVRTELRNAIAALKMQGDDDIHEARKAIKKARAIVAMLRTAGTRAIAGAARRLRRVHHRLSAARDAEVAVATFDHLRTRLGRTAHRAASAAFGRHLRAARTGQRTLLVERELRRARPALRRVGREAAEWQIPKLELGDILRALGQIYAEGRIAMRVAKRTSRPEDLHRWRRRLKTLSHELQAVDSLLGRPATEVARMKGLEALLGEHHDLVSLRAALSDAPVSQRHAGFVSAVTAAARRRERTLERLVFARGDVIYRDAPSVWTRRLTPLPVTAGRGPLARGGRSPRTVPRP